MVAKTIKEVAEEVVRFLTDPSTYPAEELECGRTIHVRPGVVVPEQVKKDLCDPKVIAALEDLYDRLKAL